MHWQSHQAHWMYIPFAMPRKTFWERVWGEIVEFFSPILIPEGRNRIDPYEPYGHWAKGWTRPARPIE